MTTSEARKVKYWGSAGEKNPAWKGGKTLKKGGDD